MPVTSSAKKALRVSEKKQIFNAQRKSAIDQALRGIKKLAKEKKISEDDEKRALEEIQKMTDAEIRRMEELSQRKEAEVMQV